MLVGHSPKCVSEAKNTRERDQFNVNQAKKGRMSVHSLRHSSTITVKLQRVETEDLLVSLGNGREGLVDLEFGDVGNGETGLFECERDGLGGSDGEIDRSAGSIGEGCAGKDMA